MSNVYPKGKAIKRLRHSQLKSRVMVAREAGMVPRTVMTIEAGGPSRIELVRRYLEVLGVGRSQAKDYVSFSPPEIVLAIYEVKSTAIAESRPDKRAKKSAASKKKALRETHEWC